VLEEAGNEIDNLV